MLIILKVDVKTNAIEQNVGRWHKRRLEISPLTLPIVIINDRRLVTCPSKYLQRNTKSGAQMLTSGTL